MQASGNVAGLCNWAEAMCTYHVVAKVVEPKIATLRVAEDELKVATKEKNNAEERMAAVQAKLDEMQARPTCSSLTTIKPRPRLLQPWSLHYGPLGPVPPSPSRQPIDVFLGLLKALTGTALEAVML
jgi:hypothetical protein